MSPTGDWDMPDLATMGDRDTLRLAMNVLGVLVLVAVVVPFLVYAVPGVVGADHGLVVLSGSMEPKMSPGDAVIVREVPPSEIEEQDIITYQRSGSETPTTHRVIEVQQTEDGAAYVTKGDANEERDRGIVPHERVVGEVVFVIPFIGHLIQFANTQTGFLVLVLTPMALFVASELWELAKSIREPETTASTDDPSTATTTAAETRTDADGGNEGFTLTRSSLQLVLLLFGLYVPYSAYVAYTTQEAWSIAAATGTAIGFLFSLVVYLASRGSDGVPTASRSPDGVVRRGDLPAVMSDRTTVSLDSVESLIQMALDRDDWVVYDEEYETYYLSRDDALYLHHAEPETDGGRAVDGDSNGVTQSDGADGSTATPETETSDHSDGETATGGGET